MAAFYEKLIPILARNRLNINRRFFKNDKIKYYYRGSILKKTICSGRPVTKICIIGLCKSNDKKKNGVNQVLFRIIGIFCFCFQF